MQRNGFGDIVVRYDGDPGARSASAVEQVWKRSIPDVPFDGRVRRRHRRASNTSARRRAAQLFAGFAVLAVVIGCLGLFGLAAFTAERRTKEIGIRKVLGARTRDIVRLLVWQFSRPVLIANLIAWPVAWWLMRDWLNGFDTRIALAPVPFLLAGALALAIAVGDDRRPRLSRGADQPGQRAALRIAAWLWPTLQHRRRACSTRPAIVAPIAMSPLR